MDITSTTETKKHCGILVPKDPWKFAKTVQNQQDSKNLTHNHSILFNKGQYFETSLYEANTLKEISELTNIPIKYNNMIIGSWKQLEDFVIAMNCLNYYVHINIDWI